MSGSSFCKQMHIYDIFQLHLHNIWMECRFQGAMKIRKYEVWSKCFRSCLLKRHKTLGNGHVNVSSGLLYNWLRNSKILCLCVFVCARTPFSQQRSLGSEACVYRIVVDKYVYLSKARTTTVEVWDKRSERMVDCIDCAQIIRYARTWHTLTYGNFSAVTKSQWLLTSTK